jgi:hypothetical protein
MIEKGHVFEAGSTCDDLIRNYTVSFINARECGRDVIRVIVPDERGKMEGMFGTQVLDCLNINSPEIITKVLELDYNLKK